VDVQAVVDFRFLGIDLAALAPFGSGAEWVEPSERSRDEMNWCAVGLVGWVWPVRGVWWGF